MGLAAWIRRPIIWLPISAALIGLLVWRARPWDAGSISSVDAAPLIAAALLSALIAGLWAARSADLLAGAGEPVRVLALIPMTAFANTLNNLTPGSAGEVVRAYLLRAHHDVGYATSGAVIFVERLGAIGYLTTTGLLAWATWLGAIPAWLAAVIAASLIAGPAIVYRAGLRPLGLIRALPLGRLLGVGRWGRTGEWLRRVDSTVAMLVGHPRRLLVFVALTAGIFAVYTAQLLLVGRAVGVELEPLAAWGALAISMTIGVLSLLPFGLGTTDLALAGLLGVAGASPAAALTMTLGYRLVSTLPLGIAGVASYAWLSARLPHVGIAEAARAVAADVPEVGPERSFEP